MTTTSPVPKWAFNFVQILANRDQATWFVGIGPGGPWIARERETLSCHQVTSIASVAPKKQPESDWKQAVNQRLGVQ